MKKLFIVAVASGLSLVACKKNETVADSGLAPQAAFNPNAEGGNSYTYKATDGSRARVIFTNKGRKGTISVQANGKTFELDRVSESAEGGTYARNGISAVVKGDSVTVSQDSNVIPLVRDVAK